MGTYLGEWTFSGHYGNIPLPFFSGLYTFSLSAQPQQQMIKAISIHSRQQTRTATITPNTMPTIDPVGNRSPGGEDTGLGTGWMKVGSLQF